MENKTAKEYLAQWDRGDSVWSIEMGGIGPGYEQALQVLAVEIIRDNIDKPTPSHDQYRTWGDATVSRIDTLCGGFSGAQVGAAKQIAFRFLSMGPAQALQGIDADRKILVSNFWPHIPTQEAHHGA
jgi:hypothetical protein